MDNTPIYWSKWLELFYEKVKNKDIIPENEIKSDKTAVIVEPRKHPLLKYVIYNFMSLLAPYGWCLHIFCGSDNINFTLNIVREFENSKNNKNIEVTGIDKVDLSFDLYNILLTNSEFYKKILNNPKYILIFQTDTILFNGDLSYFIDKNYDFVGAPWKHSPYRGCNGGLSLRNREKMIEICEKRKIYVYDTGIEQYCSENEDGFFSYTNEDLLNEKPTLEDKTKFSMEGMLFENSKGLHASYKHQSEENLKLLLEKKWKEIFNEEIKL